MFVSLSSSKMIIRVYLVALVCAVVLGRSAEKDQQNPEYFANNRDTPLVSPQSGKTDPRLDVKISHQPEQPEEPHPEIFPFPKNVGKDASDKSQLIGEAKLELSESPPIAVPPNPALPSRSRRFFLPYLSSYLYRRPYYRRPYVRGAYYPYYFGGIFGYPYYGAGYGSYGYGDYGGGYYGGYGVYGDYGDYDGGYGDYGGGFGDYGGGYGDIDIGIDSDY